MRIVTQSPCYCSECNAPDALKVRLQNPHVIEQGGFALCVRHADQLASILLQHVRREQAARQAERQFAAQTGAIDHGEGEE